MSNNSTNRTDELQFCYLIQYNGDLFLREDVFSNVLSLSRWVVGKRYFSGILAPAQRLQKAIPAACVPQFPLLAWELLEGKMRFYSFLYSWHIVCSQRKINTCFVFAF